MTNSPGAQRLLPERFQNAVKLREFIAIAAVKHKGLKFGGVTDQRGPRIMIVLADSSFELEKRGIPTGTARDAAVLEGVVLLLYRIARKPRPKQQLQQRTRSSPWQT